MTETTEQRIERVVRAACEANVFYECSYPACDEVPKGCGIPRIVRTADAISFAAGWDAAVEALHADVKRWGIEPGKYAEAANYLAAHRPGEPT